MDVSFRVLMVMETRSLRVVSSEGGDMLSMRSWNFWKDFDCLCWKQTLQATIFFDVSFFTPYFCLILFSTIIYCSTFSEVRCISEVGFRFILLVIFLFTIFKYLLLLLQHLYLLFLYLLKWVGGFSPHNIVLCISEENIPRWFLNPLLLEDNHYINCNYLLYLGSCNSLL